MTDFLHVTKFDMDKARRKNKKKIASLLIMAMAETDADYEFMASRLENTPAKIESWITGLITGKTLAMDEVSDLMLAMGLEFEFSIQRYQEPLRPQKAVEPA